MREYTVALAREAGTQHHRRKRQDDEHGEHADAHQSEEQRDGAVIL
jgi:hypothetical protein